MTWVLSLCSRVYLADKPPRLLVRRKRNRVK
nr:MAG TPA: TERF1-interacting nuclear factor 2, TRF2, shelterin complex, PROTEIN BINDING [Caudoviricetes sp.]